MTSLWKPPIVERDPEPYDPERSRLFVKAFQIGKDGKYYDMYHPTTGFEMGDSVRKNSVTMLSASPDLASAKEYNRYNPTDAKPVYVQVLSDDYWIPPQDTNPEIRMNRYRLLYKIGDNND